MDFLKIWLPFILLIVVWAMLMRGLKRRSMTTNAAIAEQNLILVNLSETSTEHLALMHRQVEPLEKLVNSKE